MQTKIKKVFSELKKELRQSGVIGFESTINKYQDKILDICESEYDDLIRENARLDFEFEKKKEAEKKIIKKIEKIKQEPMIHHVLNVPQ